MNCQHENGAFVLAVDLPSGINTDTGAVAEGAVHADLTVTFDSRKPLHTAASSAPLCGTSGTSGTRYSDFLLCFKLCS